MQRSLVTYLLATQIAACSSADPATAVDAETTSDATAFDGAGEASSSDTPAETSPTEETDGESVTKPATPSMTNVAKMAGNLHVSWKTNDSPLSAVELWRKRDAAEYGKAFTLPGIAKDQHDTGAVAPGTYCYKVRTLRGEVASEFSEERCGTP
jgi:hypothetical protein